MDLKSNLFIRKEVIFQNYKDFFYLWKKFCPHIYLCGENNIIVEKNHYFSFYIFLW